VPYKKYPSIRAAGIRFESVHNRPAKIKADEFARPVYPGSSLADFFSALPKTGAAADLLSFSKRLREARRGDFPVILGMDDAAAEAALQPLIIDLMERGWISALAVSWSVAVADFEIALTGFIGRNSKASDDYSVTEETGLLLNAGLKEGQQQKIGCGEAIGLYMTQAGFAFSSHSLIYNAYKLNIPVTVHPGGIQNPTRLHPHLDSTVLTVLGERDFFLLTSILSRMDKGGVWIQAGPSVLLAELVRDAMNFCAASAIQRPRMDMGIFTDIHPHREEENIMAECRRAGGWCRRIPGDLSLMMPLLAALLLNPCADESPPEKS